jgi:UDP-N-acetylmuramate--alanine ligase
VTIKPSASLRAGSHIHCLGIGGFGINPIARVLHELGYTVSGCDMSETALLPPLRDAGIRIEIGHDPAHLDRFQPDALLISSAVTADTPEVVAATERGIPVYKRSDILGALMADRVGIAVAGTHGKTTTTSMIATILARCGRDPTFIIGGVSKDLGANARAGGGSAFVIEADEYDRMFMGLTPRIIVLTSLEMDHPDMFDSLSDVVSLFTEFVDLLPEDGLLIGCLDSPEVAKLVDRRLDQGRPAIGYGQTFAAEWIAVGLQPNDDGGSDFMASFRKAEEGGSFVMGSVSVSLRLPGEHNALNATAALAVADTLGVDLRTAADALAEFSGTGRRFEVKGEAGGVTVIDDYAHHPTAIAATLRAARSRYGPRPIWAVWQPHTYRRTQALLDGFARCFGDADHVIITDVYRSRDTQDYGVSVQNVLDRMTHSDARHIGPLDDVIAFLVGHVQDGDVVIVMSAGDATRIGDGLLSALNR